MKRITKEHWTILSFLFVVYVGCMMYWTCCILLQSEDVEVGILREECSEKIQREHVEKSHDLVRNDEYNRRVTGRSHHKYPNDDLWTTFFCFTRFTRFYPETCPTHSLAIVSENQCIIEMYDITQKEIEINAFAINNFKRDLNTLFTIYMDPVFYVRLPPLIAAPLMYELAGASYFASYHAKEGVLSIYFFPCDMEGDILISPKRTNATPHAMVDQNAFIRRFFVLYNEAMGHFLDRAIVSQPIDGEPELHWSYE